MLYTYVVRPAKATLKLTLCTHSSQMSQFALVGKGLMGFELMHIVLVS